MVSLQEVHEYGTELEQWLRMRVHPIAIKMLKSRDEVPEGAFIPTRDWGYKCYLCQSFARSQRESLTIAMFKEDQWCFEPVVGLGLGERIQYFLDGNHRYPDSVRDKKDAAKWCQNMPHFEYGKYQGIVSAPINTCNFMPDAVVMHVTGLQATYLMITKNWIDGEDVESRLSGHAVCVYCTVPPILNHKCWLSIPCKGDRRNAFAQDDEILFTLMPEMLPDFVAGTRWLQEHEWGLPMVQAYKEEGDLKAEYAKIGEMVGMDVKNSPPRPQKYQKF